MSKNWIFCSIGFFSLCLNTLSGASAPNVAIKPGFYPNPGIIAPRGDRWVGSDHLYNLSSNINVHVEIQKPDNLNLPFSSDSLKQVVEDVFKKSGILELKGSDAAQPPLPVFHFLIMIQGVDKEYAVFCGGRLFENITVDRVHLSDQTYMQAITWENQNFSIVSTSNVDKEVRKSVTEIAQAFTGRYLFFKNIKAEIHKD